MPGESVEGSSHEISFRFQQETEQLRTGKHKGRFGGNLPLYDLGGAKP